MKKIVVIGTGGLAREFSSYFSSGWNDLRIIGFSSENELEHSLFKLPGTLFSDHITPSSVGTSEVVIAIGSPSTKKKVSDRLKQLGFTFPAIIHPSSVVSDLAIIGEGVIVSPGCVVSPNVTIGEFTYLNFSCGVGHDVKVGAHVQINPGAQLGGGSEIGSGTLIGSGSIILNGVKVGSNATIGSGSVVFSNVIAGATMLGNPAKRMRAFEK